MESGHKWAQHTRSEDFSKKFNFILEKNASKIDILDTEVANFFIQEALDIGIITKVEGKAPRNPNRVSKALAPWFSSQCR